MKFVFVLCLVGLLAASTHALDDPTVSLKGVEDLKTANFDKFVNGKKHALVEFYAPWCGHCKRLTPEYKKLGEIIAADPKLKNMVVIAKVDADADRDLGSRFGVTGFPTIKYFARGGKPTGDADNYNGARTAEAMLDFLKEKIQSDKSFGRVEVLDALVKDFSAGDKQAILSKVEAAIEDLSGDEKENAKLYVWAMKKALVKGADYFATEALRIQRIVSSGAVAAEKLQEMMKKLSVLGAFLPQSSEE